MSFPTWRQQLSRSLYLQRSKVESKFFQVANVSIDGTVQNRTMVFRGFADTILGADTQQYFEKNQGSHAASTKHNKPLVHNYKHALLATTDIRSDKFAEWHHNPKAQICWYFSKTREQYRISANIKLLSLHSIGAHNNRPSINKINRDEGLSIPEANNSHDQSQGHLQVNSIKEPLTDPQEQQLLRSVWVNLSQKAKAQFLWPQPKALFDDDISLFDLDDDIIDKQVILPNFVVVVFEPFAVDYFGLKTEPQTRELHVNQSGQWQVKRVNP